MMRPSLASVFLALLVGAAPSAAQRMAPTFTLDESFATVSDGARELLQELEFVPQRQILHETFANNDVGWCEGKEEGDFLQVFRGRYLLEDADGSRWCRTTASHEDVLIRVEISYVSGYAHSGGGVFFWNTGWDDPRPFVLVDAAEDGGLNVEIGHFDRALEDDQWVGAVPWEESDLIMPDDNVLEVVAVDGVVHVLLNGTLSHTVEDMPGPSGRYLGFLVSHSQMRYGFDNLVVLGLGPGGTR